VGIWCWDWSVVKAFDSSKNSCILLIRLFAGLLPGVWIQGTVGDATRFVGSWLQPLIVKSLMYALLGILIGNPTGILGYSKTKPYVWQVL
jgi:hypothetical protein